MSLAGYFQTVSAAGRGGGGLARFTDRVLVRSLTNRRVHLVARVDDSRGQRAFVSPPALRGRRVAWAQVTLPTAQGATGGYYGLSPVGAQARVLTATVR